LASLSCGEASRERYNEVPPHFEPEATKLMTAKEILIFVGVLLAVAGGCELLGWAGVPMKPNTRQHY
jgi:hypothetical protein